jgi:hypothetical protein
MARDPNDPNQNSIGRDESVAWREQQMREMEQRMRGMSSRDYGSGGGQFIEPIRLRDPVNPLLPEEMEILELATSEIFVSADPTIASVSETAVVSGASVDTPFQEYSPPRQQEDLLPDDFGRSLWPPGLGRAASSDVEARAILEEARRRFSSAAESVSTQRPAIQRASAASAQPAPPRQDGSGATFDGDVVPDYGDIGSTFYRDPAASQVGLVSAASDAADAMDNHNELVVELLRRVVMNYLRHEETLNKLMDMTDSDDEADEF